MQDTSTLSTLNALCHEGIVALEHLLALLNEELTALQNRDIEAITSLNTRKQDALGAIENNNAARSQVLINAQTTPDKSGLDALISTFSPCPELDVFHAIWPKLEAALQQVMEANKRNEQVLTRNRLYLDQLLATLRGQQPKNTLYTAKGNKGNYTSQSRLGKA